MFQKTLKDIFNLFSSDKGKDCLINYVWINEAPDTPDRNAACTVSFKHIDCAHENAQRYPDARIKIWIDFKFLDDRSVACLHKHHSHFAPANVELCDLNDIPQYRKDEEIFGRNTKKFIWARVDTARLIVLKHVLKTEPEPYTIYADFDVKDAKVGKAKKVLDKHGLAVGTTGAYRSLSHILIDFIPGIIENGYFAIKKGRDGRKFLHTLLARTFANATRNQNGYSQLSRLTAEWGLIKKTSTKHLTVPRVLFDMGYAIPDKKRYKNWEWN